MRNKIKVMTVFGTRPEAIKMAPVISALKRSQNIELRVCVTAQHRQMLDQVLDLFNIKPDYDLNLMKEKQDLTDITIGVLTGLRKILKEWKPEWILVHGDTTTALATSLAAYYEKISVGHVEAGLRTFEIYSPWPEEINRKIVATIAEVHFTPTNQARSNLCNEGISEDKIIVTGNTVIDALIETKNILNKDKQKIEYLKKYFSFLVDNKKIVLITGHRRENFGEGFENICYAIKELSKREDIQIVYPVHLNPNVQEPVRRILGKINNVHLIDPLDYLPFIYLMNRSHIILTDSGGIQEEAPSLGKPVLVLRNNTERPEAVIAGTVKLVGTSKEKIVNETAKLLDDNALYIKMALSKNPYGDGQAAEKILDYILQTRK